MMSTRLRLVTENETTKCSRVWTYVAYAIGGLIVMTTLNVISIAFNHYWWVHMGGSSGMVPWKTLPSDAFLYQLTEVSTWMSAVKLIGVEMVLAVIFTVCVLANGWSSK